MPPDDDDRQRLFRLLNEVGIIAQLSGTAFERVMPGEMTLSRFVVLNHLTRVGYNRTPLSIANAMQVTKGAMTNTLGHLERQNLVAIVPDATDGRSKRVSLTDAGRAAHRAAIAALAPELDGLSGEMAVAEIDRALPVLEKLRKVLDARRDG